MSFTPDDWPVNQDKPALETAWEQTSILVLGREKRSHTMETVKILGHGQGNDRTSA